MQQIHRAEDPELRWTSADAPPELDIGGYGYGLFVWQDVRLGPMIGHGGGYPGYGSHMRWHPASGIGVVGFSNMRYGPVVLPVRDALRALVGAEPKRARRPRPWPETLSARSAVDGLLETWDDATAAELFAMNIELDEPVSLRRAAIERLVEVHGRLEPDASQPAVSDTPAHLVWWLRGERGRVRIEILMTPERPTRIQKLAITSIPEASAALAGVAERVVALILRPAPAWPEDLALTADVDREALDRTLRAAEAVWGPVDLGPVIGGDGRTVARWRLPGPRGDLELELATAESTSEHEIPPITRVTLVPATLTMPIPET
jgi:serine-type D-Ala-D-Ala carboxypeptidase/endopeptidase